jgi:monoterpene epsilon-lactone hydrolase
MDTDTILARAALRLDAREIPIPAHLSPAARMFLAAAAMQPAVPEPAGSTQAEWDAAAAAWDERILPGMEAILAQIPITPETTTIGDCHIHIATPPNLPPHAARYAFLDIHGGGLVFGAGRFARAMAVFRAASLGCRVVSVDYRVPPAHPYPAPLDDCLATYRHLLDHHAPADIAVSGLSAGGNLAAAMLLRARDEGLAMPAAALLMTPELDLTESGDTFHTNATIDVALPAGLPRANALYADGADLAHPYISPLFGDFAPGFPPCFLQSGTRDLFLSNTVRMHRALLRAGQYAELHVWEAMPHAGFGGATPEDVEMQTAMREFLVRRAGWSL